MTTTADLSPAAGRITALVQRIRDEQLTAPTPCTEFIVRDLLVHLVELALAFRDAATKTPMSGQGNPGQSGAVLDGWRVRLPAQLADLVGAWRDPAAWEGMTEVGGIPLSGAMAGGFARNELVLHGWDLSAATGQPFNVDAMTVDACLSFTAEAVEQGFSDAYGPPVAVDDKAPPLHRLLGLAGRDPSWTAPTAGGLSDVARTAERPQ